MKKNVSSIGVQLMNWAELLAWIEGGVVVLIGVIVLFTGGFLSGIILVVSGVMSGYLVYILLYGFGQLVEDNRAMRENSDRLVRHFLNGEKQSGSFGPGADSFSYQSVAGNNKPDGMPAGENIQSDVRYCTNCGTAITPGRDTCWKCGEKL
jgi:hypothetical protein